MVSEGEDSYFFDGEAIARVLLAPLAGKLCSHVKALAGEGRVYSCRRCFNDAVEGYATPVSAVIPKWGFILIDDDEKIDIECARLISNINPAFMVRPDIYQKKLVVVAKCRLSDCVLVTDDVGLSSSSMENICDELHFPYETFDDLFGNI
jgi:hypothetical protein